MMAPLVALGVEGWSLALAVGLSLVGLLMSFRYKYWNSKGVFWQVAFALAVAACLAENSAITWYGHYSYSPQWGLFLGHVPLHVVLIWPLFILGEYHYLQEGLRLVPEKMGLRAAFCFVDTLLLANLIETYCVSAGLWSWRHQNCLGVPWLGAVGWGLFATAAVMFLTSREQGLLLAWHGGARHLTDVQIPAATTSAAILLLQFVYQLAVVGLELQPILPLSEELPRLLACAIVAGLWLLKGQVDWEICSVSAASLIRIFAFELA
ncbi:unnamed protein product [Polarella glacialis]|uniref:Uncharacterized protein n=1 Tax=Polarella glacialis TaxID=89957 RepID=A0A813KG47_POLGL|nr:unnamed protein product [Polarella glacialis]